LELIDPSFDNTLAESWQASLNHGTPGQVNSTGVAVENEIVTAKDLNLNNYPNPFNPSTIISFNVLSGTHDTEISIFNIKGQKIKTLIKEKMTVDTHSVTWNGKDDSGRNVASGVYFYQLKNGSISDSKKMILMK
jgi:flagellar hook assembly protein FlgD